MTDYNFIIDKYYPVGTLRRDIYLKHCRQVTDKALRIAAIKQLDLEPDIIESAAMLHDIGIVFTNASGIDCHGDKPYIAHGYLGADLLRKEGFPEAIACVAERHTGAGIDIDDITELKLPLPTNRIMMPESLLERLVCYADKFFSKSGDMKEKTLDRVRNSMMRHSKSTLERFEKLHNEFSIEDK